MPPSSATLRLPLVAGRESKPWRMPERLTSPYAERVEHDPWLVDRALLAVGERVGSASGWRLRRLIRFAARVEAEEPAVAGLSDAALREAALALRPLLLRDGFSDNLLVRCFALTREAGRRLFGKRLYPVQIMGARALIEGWLAEMATGEGKTLTAAPAAIAAALAALPVHVVTVNDYLAERDAGLLRPLYEWFGLSVGLCLHGQSPRERRLAYGADVTYGANKEIAFDYLRDRIALGGRRSRAARAVADLVGGRVGGEALLLRGLGFAIVDEADSVLIDEARTPLIISGEGGEAEDAAAYAAALEIASRLTASEHFELMASRRVVRLTERGRARVEALARLRSGLLGVRRGREELVEQALAALHLFERDRHYVVAEGEVRIVDEQTGRIAEGRSWERGLHQLIETKEGLPATARRRTLARITYQRFFRRYLRLSGMTGTATEVAAELRAVYGLAVVRIPPNRPCLRRDLGVRLLPDQDSKWRAVAERARSLVAEGRPVLVGTRSIAASERLSALLAAEGVPHRVLNARFDREEAEIVARAGERGALTVATNMAGRGTDIALGPGVAAAGGLHVIITEYHESRRIDRQLVGRAARQGDPGSFEAIVAADDELFRLFAWPGLARLVWRAPFRELPLRLLLSLAQTRAEAQAAAARRRTMRADREIRRSLGFAGRPE